MSHKQTFGRKNVEGLKKRNRQYGNEVKGFCVCSECGKKTEHQQGVPCNTIKCPKCGANMYRE